MERGFFRRDTREVARDLLGCRIVKEGLSGKIVETEAYLGSGDPASHASTGKTDRNSSMFGEPGKAYVYLSYGVHDMFNVVAHQGKAGAVLIRAVRPEEGVDSMRERRGVEDVRSLCDGPGKLCEAFGIDQGFDGEDLLSGDFRIEGGDIRGEVEAGPRVGISEGLELDYRFYLDSAFVSTR